MDMMRVEAL